MDSHLLNLPKNESPATVSMPNGPGTIALEQDGSHGGISRIVESQVTETPMTVPEASGPRATAHGSWPLHGKCAEKAASTPLPAILSREREASEETQSTRPLIAVAELKDVEVTLGPPVSGSPKAVPEVNESSTTTTTTTTQVNELRTTASRTIVLQTNEAHTIESRTTETQATELESREMESWLTFQQAAEPQATKVTEATKEDRWYDFESHYGLSRNSIRDALQEVLDDMATHKSIHNWDRKLHITPLKHLVTAVSKYLSENEDLNLNSLLSRTAVEEIFSLIGVNHQQSAMQQSNDIDGHLFFTKCSSKKGRRLLSEIDKSVSTQDAGKTERSGSAKVMQGRIVLVKEHIHPLERAVLLILFSLCIRLQNEDYGYIHAFIERHLSLRNVLKSPHRWQLMSSPHINSSVQRYYKRVTLSCHIIYLTLNHGYISNPDAAIVDRTLLFPLHKQADGKTPKYVFKASTSVLLTIAIPEESASRQEETNLLKSPKGLWTVMVVNHALRLTLDQDQEPVENLTPIAQYLRGIALSVNTQTMSAEAIYDHLKEQLAESENGSLFDDEQFSKSELYHWTIKTCDELRESITSSQRFLTQAFNKQISQLCLESNDSEKIGVDFWKMQLDEEMYALEELRSQIVALNAQVQESRSALHGVTAVLEARIALQQGDRIKTLAYLATIYLPLTATSSLYSMSVLPSAATLWSFFIVLAVLLLCTIITGLSFKSLKTKLRSTIQSNAQAIVDATLWTRTWRIIRSIMSILFHRLLAPVLSIAYVQKYADMIKPSQDLPFKWSKVFKVPTEVPRMTNKWLSLVIRLLYVVCRVWPRRLVHYALVPELLFLRDQYHLFSYLGESIGGVSIYWHPLGLARDVLRFFMFPVWFGLIILIVCFLVLQDGVLVLIKVLGYNPLKYLAREGN